MFYVKNSSKLNGIRTIDLLPCLQDSSSMSSRSPHTQTYSCPIALAEGTLPVLLPVIEGLKGNICLITEMKTVWMAWIPRARLFEKKNHSRHPSSWSLAPKVDQWVGRVINPAMQKTVFFVKALLSASTVWEELRGTRSILGVWIWCCTTAGGHQRPSAVIL